MSVQGQEKLKKSILIGALTSSFGVFVSKLLGLLYYSPLCAMAGEENMVFYSITYSYYDVLLTICTAGIPFAITSLVSAFILKKDYKSALYVKKIGSSFVLLLGFVCSFIFFILSGPLAKKALGRFASPEDIQYLKVLFLILIIAVIFVPYLSVIRGYFQGLKRFDLYASSQVLEQFIRVLCIIVFGAICVYIFKLENIYAIYCAIGAASIGAIASIIFFKFFGKKDEEYIVIDDSEGLWLLLPYFEKYIPNFSVYDFVNPIKSDTFNKMADEMIEQAKELRNNNETIKADFIEAFVWYFKEHKLMDCSCSDKIINIVGY
ncbi:MAG: oligosaccharide flippase family protein [Bacillota bacterium]|nr:oligosaccharide flippase family protein [Bacillota bacterium]